MDFLLGRSVGSLDNPAVTFARAFAEVQRVQSLMSRMGPAMWLLPKKKYHDGIKILNEFVNPFIDEALRLSPADVEKKRDSDSRYTFLHALAGFTRDRTVLRDQLIAVLLAGRDTTACTLSWLFYELSKQPRIVKKLRNEITDQVGLHRRPTYVDLKAMRYLQHTVNETLRIYPIVPFNVRDSLKDTTLPRGGGPNADQPIGVPKGTPIGYSTLIMQRREDLYPPTSSGFPPIEDFVPERWDGWTPKAWTYIPFNGGPRLCVGQQFALTEIAYTVTRILQRFARVESRMDGEFPGMQSDIVLQPAKGVKVAFYEDSREK
jgi:cytochrome P450